MELLLIFAALLVFFSIMLTPSLSMQIQDQPLEQGSRKVDELQFYLPRKLRVVEVADEKAAIKGGGGGVEVFSTSNNKQNAEWMKRASDTKQLFTMDYSHVRRKRPIHNYSLPVTP